MKEIDIEKLPRENIYTQPEPRFDLIQEKVLENVRQIQDQKHETLRIRKSRITKFWLAAAVIVMIVGLIRVLSTHEKATLKTYDQELSWAETHLDDTLPKTEDETHFTHSMEPNQHPADGAIPATRTKVSHHENAREIWPKSHSKALRAEQVINVLPAEDISMLTQNIELDVYLDLYQ